MSEIDELIIHPHLLQKFLRYKKDYGNLLALYTFYLYQSKVQKTNAILATDNFTKNGIGWGLDKVKRIKKLLKELKIISLTQKSNYSYIKILFLYGRKKTEEVLEKVGLSREDKREDEVKTTQLEVTKEKEESTNSPATKNPKVEKSTFHTTLEENNIPNSKIDFLRESTTDIITHINLRRPFHQKLLAQWIIYCEKNSISYTQTHLKNWLLRFKKYTSFELEKAIYTAMSHQWKEFYVDENYEPIYKAYLGKDLRLNNKEFKNFYDIQKVEGKFVYLFQNGTLSTTEDVVALFKKEEEIKSAISFNVKAMLSKCIKRIE